MATIHKNKNHLEDFQSKYLLLSILFFIPTALYGILFVTQGYHFEGIWHLTAIIPAAIGGKFWHKYKSINSGIEGEKTAINSVSELPSGYTGISSVRVSYDGKDAELDLVVVGPNGVFIVETKNHNGEIAGNVDSSTWTQHKVGRKGGEYTNTMKNPLKQVKRQVWILSNYLKDNGTRAWVEGCVFFSNPSVDVRLDDFHAPVFNSKYQLNKFIENYEPKKKIEQERINKILRLL
ncbi:nuclease-related domain-containing protein [Bacillus pinisoli]|uniref:nuclease-related domain-containing protein n=1 Tax=Bacillus pinisoli TaxID=2901866 RepID=UPI001FF61F9B|nr:nuclease-related domain-containing protein [Bacillus pinisoli]